MDLKKYENNVESQFGEDGIIEEIIKRIGIENKVFVEFGAWDGIKFSNTYNLWKNKEWSGLLIEGDESKYKTLSENIRGFEDVKALNCFVTYEGENKLDNIFDRYKLPVNLDLLSIDIDGDDYYVFESLKKYFPRLILIEFNPTIPPHLKIIQSKGEYFGASALSILELAKVKGYKLAHMTDTNMFFVIESEYSKLNIAEPVIGDLFPYQHLTYVITSFDGTPFISGVPVFCDEIQQQKKGKEFLGVTIKRVDDKNVYPKIETDIAIEPILIYKPT